MKAFFEEYGFVLVSIIVVMMLIGLVGGVKDDIQEAIGSAVDKLDTAVDAKLGDIE